MRTARRPTLFSPAQLTCSLILLVLLFGHTVQSGWWGGDEAHGHEHGHEEEEEEEVEDSQVTKIVTCGSVLKLKHIGTGYRLHSHQVPSRLCNSAKKQFLKNDRMMDA